MNNLLNLLEIASESGDLTLLLKGIQLAELTDTLNSEGSFTILAPTDEVFRQLPQAELDALFDNVPKLKRILLYHVLFGDVRSDDLIENDEAPTMEGSIVAIEHSEGKIRFNDAQATELDLLANNGVIHKISAVLMPAIASHEYD
jgi:uncharacterized surface protein with fasciclin (FAS1) repeats